MAASSLVPSYNDVFRMLMGDKDAVTPVTAQVWDMVEDKCLNYEPMSAETYAFQAAKEEVLRRDGACYRGELEAAYERIKKDTGRMEEFKNLADARNHKAEQRCSLLASRMTKDAEAWLKVLNKAFRYVG